MVIQVLVYILSENSTSDSDYQTFCAENQQVWWELLHLGTNDHPSSLGRSIVEEGRFHHLRKEIHRLTLFVQGLKRENKNIFPSVTLLVYIWFNN